MKHSQNYTILEFIDRVITEAGLTECSEVIKDQLRAEIARALMNRLNTVFIDKLTDDQIFLIKKNMEDHEELSMVEVMGMIASNDEELRKFIGEEIEKLFTDLVKMIKK